MDHGERTAAGGAGSVGQQPGRGEAATARRLLLASFLMLFLELALIRWLGANIVDLS